MQLWPSSTPRGPLMQDKLQESPLNFKRAQEKCLSKRKGERGREGGAAPSGGKCSEVLEKLHQRGMHEEFREQWEGREAFPENGNGI